MKIDDYNLTNDAKFLISSMYKEYLSRLKDNLPKRSAVLFGNSESIHRLMPEWSKEDTDYTVEELIGKGLLKGHPVLGGYLDITLTTDAVAMLQMSFKDKIDTVLDYATKIKNLIIP